MEHLCERLSYEDAMQQLRDYFRQHGEAVDYKKGERLECESEPTRWYTLVESGCFKYVVYSPGYKRDCIINFSFAGDFAGDYPNVLYNNSVSQYTIEAVIPCRVLRVSSEHLKQFFHQSSETMNLRTTVTNCLVKKAQLDFISLHYKPHERYELLFQRCPAIVRGLPQSVIASYLGITPKKLSTFRSEVESGNSPPHSLA